MGRYWLLFGVVLGGCLASNGLQYEAMSTDNQYHLTRVHKGMSQRQVLHIMKKPYSYEFFEFDNDIYDVWFYVTKGTVPDQTRMVPQNLTPLTFRNGVLVGMGYSYYYFAMKGEAKELEAQKPSRPPAKTAEQENLEFEETLKALQQSPRGQSQQGGTPARSNQNEILGPTKTPAPSTQKGASPASASKTGTTTGKPAAEAKKGAPKPGDETQKKEQLPPNVHIISKNEMQGYDEAPDYAPQFQTAPKTYAAPRRKFCARNRFEGVVKGMTESQVYQLCGEPNKYETFQLSSDHYDAWFYDTVQSNTERPPLVPQNQTVFLFKNAVLMSLDDEKFWELKQRVRSHVIRIADGEPQVLVKEEVGVTSQQEFSLLQIGMSGEDVANKIGEAKSQETIATKKNIYHIWFYDVRQKNGDIQTLPLTFKNGHLIGKTDKIYQSVKNKNSKPCKDCFDEGDERMIQDASEQDFNYW